MDSVRARFGDHVDVGARSAAIGRIILAGLDAELFDCVRIRNRNPRFRIHSASALFLGVRRLRRRSDNCYRPPASH